jgi:hypothetical protein
MKKLRIWNGRNYNYPYGHMYIAAYSVEDAVRLLTELHGHEPRGIRAEIRNYWSPNCWGIVMDGITPERGIWVTDKDNDMKPKRLI